jgi:hypothetical protein
MKVYGGVDIYFHVILTSALVGGEWLASRPGRFTAGERTPGTHWIGGWVDPRAGLDEVEKRKFLYSNSEPSIVQPVASRYTDCAIPAPNIKQCIIIIIIIIIIIYCKIWLRKMRLAPNTYMK